MSVGSKIDVLGRIWEFGSRLSRCGIAQSPCARSLTFLVLRLIDLTNEMASMTDSLLFTLRGTSIKKIDRIRKM
jgi:hypothetical protein